MPQLNKLNELCGFCSQQWCPAVSLWRAAHCLSNNLDYLGISMGLHPLDQQLNWMQLCPSTGSILWWKEIPVGSPELNYKETSFWLHHIFLYLFPGLGFHITLKKLYTSSCFSPHYLPQLYLYSLFLTNHPLVCHYQPQPTIKTHYIFPSRKIHVYPFPCPLFYNNLFRSKDYSFVIICLMANLQI